MKKPTPEEIRKMEQELMMPSQLQLPTVKNILPRDKNGRPVIKLEEIENTVVHTPTQDEYNSLMPVYECAGWNWGGLNSPTGTNHFSKYNSQTCINIKKIIEYSSKAYWNRRGYSIIVLSDFYKKQKISPETLLEINKYFKQRKK